MHDAAHVAFNLDDFIQTAAVNGGHSSHAQDEAELDIFAEFTHQQPSSSTPTATMNIDTAQALLQSLSNVQLQQNQSLMNVQLQQLQADSNQSTPNAVSPEVLDLKQRLEQQLRLQQLQQLILQQQMELLKTSTSTSTLLTNNSQNDMFNGLMTPGPSTELPAMMPKELVPPMMLQPEMTYMNSPTNAFPPQQHPQLHLNPNPSFSAPAALAFQTTSPYPIPNLSPLTSPFLFPHGASNSSQVSNFSHVHSQNNTHALSHPSTPHALHPNIPAQSTSRPRLKRTGSVDDQDMPRKRSSRATPSSSGSTPAHFAGDQYLVPSNDSPSPVDLSSVDKTMPPPGPSSAASHTSSAKAAEGTNASIAPMTPASILNLRKTSTGLVSSPAQAESSSTKAAAQPPAPSKRTTRGKVTVTTPATTSSTTTGRGRRGSTAKTAFSPGLKPLLPGAQPPTPTSPLALPTNPTVSRKPSHKIAEQKRRDSLKTSFDDLRYLLPPVLLPEDEELLPGCMPPRGPPKGDADGPNRGVSKLALLRCGNVYIKELKEQVKRRDVEIDRLREEVKRLRTIIPQGADPLGDNGIDVERDVDEGKCVEAGIRVSMKDTVVGGTMTNAEGDDDD